MDLPLEVFCWACDARNATKDKAATPIASDTIT
jgi:hypothetical protein